MRLNFRSCCLKCLLLLATQQCELKKVNLHVKREGLLIVQHLLNILNQSLVSPTVGEEMEGGGGEGKASSIPTVFDTLV